MLLIMSKHSACISGRDGKTQVPLGRTDYIFHFWNNGNVFTVYCVMLTAGDAE